MAIENDWTEAIQYLKDDLAIVKAERDRLKQRVAELEAENLRLKKAYESTLTAIDCGIL